MEGGAFRTKSFEKTSRNYVFVYQHQTREDSVDSYRLVTEEYLPEDFLHPAYFFLRPDGTEADPANRHHHEALSAGQMEKILAGIQKEWGRGLDEKDYAAAKAKLEEAEAHLAAGEREAAVPLLEELAKLRERCGIKDRAKAWLTLIGEADALLPAVAEASADAAKSLGALDVVGAWRTLGRMDGEAPEALAGKLLDAIRAHVRLAPVRLERVFLSTGSLYYLRAEWATELPQFDGLVLQLSYLTDAPKSFEGFAKYREMEPFGHHRAAFSMSHRAFRLKDVVNGRAQLWLDGVLLGESLKAETPADFPWVDESVMEGPELLGEDDTLGARVKAKLEDYRIGRYPPARTR